MSKRKVTETKQTVSNRSAEPSGAIKAVVGIALAGVLAAGVCCMGYASRNDDGRWFSNWNLSTWHWSDRTEEKPQIDNGSTPKEEYVGAVIGKPETSGTAFYSARLPRAAYAANAISETADSAYVLSVDVEPSYATNKEMDWTIDFQDVESEWATGKAVTDYGIITPAEDGATTATFTCLKDFGEPLIITVTSRSNPEVSATCTVDYYQRIKSVEYKFKYDGAEIATPTPENGVYKLDYTDEQKNYTVELVPVYSDYTVAEEFTTVTSSKLSETFGYAATSEIPALTLTAGLENEPKMSAELKAWCTQAEAIVDFIRTTNPAQPSTAMSGIYNLATTQVNNLSETDKQHPKFVAYYAVMQRVITYSDLAIGCTEYCSGIYSNKSGTKLYGTNIPFENFYNKVIECNTAGVGVVQHTISISGAHSSYSTVLNLSYTEEMLIKVRDIKLNGGNLTV